MKEWLTAREIADLRLPDMPETERGAQLYAARNGWNGSLLVRDRKGQGGGIEYSIRLLPTLAQVAYSQRHLVVDSKLEDRPARETPGSSGLSARAQLERDAKLAILAAYQRFSAGLRLGHATLVQVYVDKYNCGSIDVAPWVREAVPSLSKRTLIRWKSAKRDGRANALAYDPAAARKGTGVLDTANGGKVRAFVLGLIAQQPYLSAHHVRALCRDEFGDRVTVVSKGVETSIDMPPVRTFQHALRGFKQTHRVELTKLTNPDLYRSTLAPAGVGTLRQVTEPNQLWQIDASPIDVLCVDGRHSIYAAVDIAPRRMIFQVSRTPRASAVALLMRRAIIAWGVPDKVKTDNGTDFTARDTERLLLSLDIEVELSDPYQPQQKGHIERGIRTFQHEIGPLLPGFIGHSVADRKAIESRKSFAQRLGESEAETFSVSLTGAELQEYIDQWATAAYQHRPHAGLKGDTPFKAALASTRPIRRVDERALDLLLMPVAGSDGRRTVTKFGIRIDHYHYLTPNILPGTIVFVRQDPNDLGRAFAFSEDGGRFLGDAICAELAGINPQAFVAEAKAMQREIVDERSRPIRDEARRLARGPALIERVLNVARRDAPNVIPLPKREEKHSTEQIAAAIEAMGERLHPARELTPREAAEHRRMVDEMLAEDAARIHDEAAAVLQARADEIETARTAHLPKSEKVVALPETPKERYRRAVLFGRQLEAGTIAAADAVWLGGYQLSAEFKAHRQLHEDFGDAWLMS